ncbi:MAG: transcriptional regulator [Verrucomicrobia bacterium]|nr:MAG: transcriptional regulator [Verrucomicrobiota bacterium]
MLNELGQQIQQEFRANDALCQRVIRLIQLLANKCRFRILCVLTRGEFCVNDIAEIVGETKLSNISQQLRLLTLAGVVTRRRHGREILYRLADERVRELIDHLRRTHLHADAAELSSSK